jgi:hypothetical protein
MAQSERIYFQKSKQMMVNNDSNLHSESTDHNNNMASSGASGMKQVNMNNQMPIDKFYKPLCSEAAVNNENTNNSAGSKHGGQKKRREKSTGKRTVDKKATCSPQFLQCDGSGGQSGKLSGSLSGR